MSSSSTLADAVPPVPDLPESRSTPGTARLARLWERNQTLIPTLAALALVAGYGKETRGRDLRDLDPDGHTFEGTGI